MPPREQQRINNLIHHYKLDARRALQHAHVARLTGNRGVAIRNLKAAVACTWLAVGALRTPEAYNARGMRL